VILVLAASMARAARPTEGGAYAYDESDTVSYLDGALGRVRTWYSTSGTNQVQDGDEDGNGVPDFAETVAREAEQVLALYEALGFLPVVSDEGGGGSDAIDAYLVDFAGTGDGNFATESCTRAGVCSGYFQMENDFKGYGYRSDEEAIRVLVSHELFHAVQAAYDAGEEVWFSEGTATWAERMYDPESQDFLYFAQAYLDDTGRSLDEPPAGPVPTFAYATALWWWYLSERLGHEAIVELLAATPGDTDMLAALAALLEARGTSLAEEWPTFAQWNLATGARAGAIEGYDFAAELTGIPALVDGDTVMDDNRFYPLAASYYGIAHPGGPLRFAIEEEAPALVFHVMAVDDAGRVQPPLATFAGADQDLGDLPAGEYWLVGSNPTLDTQSTKREFCFGGSCASIEDSGVVDSGGDSGAGGSNPGNDDGGDAPASENPACGCGTSSAPGAGLAGALVAALVARARVGRHA
jgi:hypothetical protein